MNQLRIFISHAFEDKADFVEALAQALSAEKDFKVWYDEYELRLGDRLLDSISRGLHECDYGIVVFSQSFFKKKWTSFELDGLFAKETAERKVILPIWHRITREEILGVYPPLADRFAVKSDVGIPAIVEAVGLAVGTGDRARQVGDSLDLAFTDVRDMSYEHDLNEQLSRTEEGVKIVKDEVVRLFDLFDKQLDRLDPSGNFLRNRRDKPPNLWVPNAVASVRGRFGIILTLEYVNQFSNATTDAALVVSIYTLDDEEPYSPGKRKVIEKRTYLPRFTGDRRVCWRENDLGDEESGEDVVEGALLSFATAIKNRF